MPRERWRQTASNILQTGADVANAMEGHVPATMSWGSSGPNELLPWWYRRLPGDALRAYRDTPLLRAEIARQVLLRLLAAAFGLILAGAFLLVVRELTGDLSRCAARTALWWTNDNIPRARPLAGVLGALYPVLYLVGCIGLAVASTRLLCRRRWLPFTRPLIITGRR